jgi:predicted transcriptional regulator
MTQKEFLENFSYNLQRTMEDYGFNLSDLSNVSGVSKSCIHYYLTGEKIPTVKNLINLMTALDCEFSDLVETVDYITD